LAYYFFWLVVVCFSPPSPEGWKFICTLMHTQAEEESFKKTFTWKNLSPAGSIGMPRASVALHRRHFGNVRGAWPAINE
jgi:hypothetical protein